MKIITTMKKLILLLLAAALVAGCNKEEESLFAGSDNAIAEFTLVKDGITLHGAVSHGGIVISAPERFELSGATATVTLSENATITPAPASVTDWNTAQTFTVTAYNGATKTYAYRVERYRVALEGDVALLTQADVNAFTAELEAQGIEQLNGNITIGIYNGKTPEDTITSLAGMEILKVVTGAIVINPTYKGDVTAFENLEKVNGLSVLSKEVKLVRFPKLTTVHAALTVEYSSQRFQVETIDFPQLVTVDKNLRLYGIDSVSSLNFPKLQRVLTDLYIYASSQKKLRSIDFPELTVVGGTFEVRNLNSLESISAPKLETVGTLSTQNLTALAEVTFPALETVTGNISFPASATLTTLGFPALKSAGSLTIPNAVNLTLTAQSFPVLKTVTGELSVQLLSFTSFEAFGKLESVGKLTLSNLSTLTSLPPMSASTYYLDGLTALTQLDVRGVKINSLELRGTTMTGLTLIGNEEFSGKLYIGNPPSGTTSFPITVEGFKKVGALQIAANYLTAIDFPWLEEVYGLLDFSSGSAITEINLPNLKKVGAFKIQTGISRLRTLSVPQLAEIAGYPSDAPVGFNFALGSSIITTIGLPALKSVVGDVYVGWLNRKIVETISFPALETVTGTLTITINTSMSSSSTIGTFKDLSGFGKLKSVAGVNIRGFTNLVDFSPLAGVIPILPPEAWTVELCGYNPTYQDMVDGKYTN